MSWELCVAFVFRLESFDAGGYIMNNESMMQSVDQQKFQEKKARKNKKKELRDKGVIEAENIPGKVDKEPESTSHCECTGSVLNNR